MQQVEEENLPRGFKGIWIPKEIWVHPDLSFLDRCLWAEINSLDDEIKGCTASNAYLCKIFDIKERWLQRSLAKLKKAGLIKMESFDGRKRSFRTANFNPSVTSEVVKTPPPGWSKRHPPSTDFSIDKPPVNPTHIDIEIKEERIEEERGVTKAPPTSVKIGKFVSLSKEEYEELCVKHGQQVIDDVASRINDYLLSKGKKPYADYAATIRNWLRRENKETSTGGNTPGKIDRSPKDNQGNRIKTPYDDLF